MSLERRRRLHSDKRVLASRLLSDRLLRVELAVVLSLLLVQVEVDFAARIDRQLVNNVHGNEM